MLVLALAEVTLDSEVATVSPETTMASVLRKTSEAAVTSVVLLSLLVRITSDPVVEAADGKWCWSALGLLYVVYHSVNRQRVDR